MRQWRKAACIVGLAVVSVCGMLSGCDKKSSAPQQKTRIVTAVKRATSTHLYYNGTIAPIKTISAVSPVDGRIASINFEYGAQIKSGQTLVTIDSQDLADKFRSAISDYLTSKQTLSTQRISFEGDQALYNAGIIMRSEYITERSTYETAQVTFYQKKLALEKVLKQAEMPVDQFERLSISDTKKVNHALSYKFSNLPVVAKGAGVALFPVQDPNSSTNTGDDTNGQKLIVGSQVKQGQLILSIGDLSGLSVTFKVGEVDINRIKTGLKVIVSGVSFPNQYLKGYISAVASQADEGSGSQALAQFDVTVMIPKLSSVQRKLVHIGMTSKVDIEIENPAEVMVPIGAVDQVDGQNMVTVVNSKNQHKQVPVVTGATDMTDVAILSGLKEGQKVVVNDSI